MDTPQPKRGFKIKMFTNKIPDNDPIFFECNVPDIIADIQTACDNGLGRLTYPNDQFRLFGLSVSELYDYAEVLEWLRGFED